MGVLVRLEPPNQACILCRTRSIGLRSEGLDGSYGYFHWVSRGRQPWRPLGPSLKSTPSVTRVGTALVNCLALGEKLKQPRRTIRRAVRAILGFPTSSRNWFDVLFSILNLLPFGSLCLALVVFCVGFSVVWYTFGGTWVEGWRGRFDFSQPRRYHLRISDCRL